MYNLHANNKWATKDLVIILTFRLIVNLRKVDLTQATTSKLQYFKKHALMYLTLSHLVHGQINECTALIQPNHHGV